MDFGSPAPSSLRNVRCGACRRGLSPHVRFAVCCTPDGGSVLLCADCIMAMALLGAEEGDRL